MGEHMIYTVYAATFLGAYAKERPKQVAELIKSAPEEASFVFILTTTQISNFRLWVEEYKLKDLIQYVTPEPITNGSHPDSGRRLYIFVLSKSEIKESGYVTATNIRGQA